MTVMVDVGRLGSVESSSIAVSSTGVVSRLMIASWEVIVVQSEIETEQAWYWSPAWQAAERAADEEWEAGEFDLFDNADELLAAL